MQQPGHLLYLRGFCHHRDGSEAEIQVEYQDECDGRQPFVLAEWTEVALEGFLYVNALEEIAPRVESRHLPQEFHGTAQASWILSILLPDALNTGCTQLGDIAQPLVKHLRRDVQLNTQIHHLPIIGRFDTCWFAQILLHQQQPIVVVPRLFRSHSIVFFGFMLQNYKLFFIFAHKFAELMRKILLSMVLAVIVTGLEAQSIRDEIRNNLRCSAGNYMAYPVPAQLRLTKAPAGKQPFYISHYGRYGSRYNNWPHDYSTPYQTLAKADSLGKLTDLGKDVLHRLVLIRQEADEKYGELTILGALQQHLIIKRMVERFPEVFTDNSTVDARSTTLLRCYLTMENAMVQLSRMRPNVNIHHNATHRDMYFLNQMDRHLLTTKMDSATTARYKAFSRHLENNSRLMQSLFNDTAYIHQHVNIEELNASLFKIASNLQSMDVSHQMTLYDLYTDDEIYRNWERENAWWYINYGFCTLNGGKQPYSQRNLLRKIINDADSCIQMARPNVQLRFGHETVLLPLVCLLEINNFGLATDDLDALDRKGWAAYKIIPMAANIQFVFYRESPDDKDVLFKVLLNENEVRLPLKSIDAPYYHWRDFRNYYLKKLDAYVE